MKRIYFVLTLVILLAIMPSARAQWQKQNNTFGVYTSITGSSQIVLAAADYRFLFSEDAGKSWSNRTDFQQRDNFVLRKGNTFFVQNGGDFLMSSDGKTWEKKNGYGYRMATDETILLGSTANKLYKSSDNGTTWQLLNLTLSIGHNINALAVAGNTMYAAHWDGLYQSSDNGQTWKLNASVASEVLSVSALGSDVLVATRYSGIFYSNNSGQTWTNLREDYSNTGIKGSQFSATYITGNTFFVGSLYTGKVYQSDDKGKSWKDISAGLPTNIGIGAIALIDNTLYLGTNVSTDGAIWKRNVAELAEDFLLAPTSLAGNTTVRDQTLLNWIDNSTNETGFKIERSIADTSHFVEIGNVPKNSTSFRDNHVVNDQVYYYQVRAYNSNKTSAYSNRLALRRLPTTCEDYVQAGSSPLYDVYFASPSKGFAVGDFGKLIKTENGGESWQDVRHCTGGSYTSIVFPSALIGYASGYWGNLIKTTDGGENWQNLSSPVSSYSYTKVFFLNDTLGFLVGKEVYKTTDGGYTWKSIYQSWDDINDVFFFNDSTGFAAGRSNTLIQTNNGGTTWQTIDLTFLGFNKSIRKITFINATTGFIGGDGFIAKTTDRGKTWRRVEPAYTSPYINDIYFPDATTGYATSGFNGGNVYKTTDGGETWQSFTVGGTPYSIHFNGNTGCIVGETDAGSTTVFGRLLALSKDGGASWKLISNAGYDSYSNGSFVTDKIGYLIPAPTPYTANNIYFKTTDGGENWLKQSTNKAGKYSYIKFFNEQKGVLVGDDVLKTEDGGQTWTSYPHTIGSYSYIRGVDFVDENTWFLCTYTEGRIYKTTDGGKTLLHISQIPGPLNTLISLDFIDSQVGFAGTLFGKIYRTTDGGKTWHVVYDDYNGSNYTGIFSIHFVNSQIGYASGTKGVILKTQDGGSTWQYVPGEFVGFSQRDLVQFNKIRFFNDKIGYVASHNPGASTLYKTTDGGKKWFRVNTFDNDSFTFIHFVDQNTAIVAGGDGLIVRLNHGMAPCKPAFFSGKTKDVCLNTSYSYSVASTSTLSYEWKVTGGTIIHSNRNSISIQWNQTGKQQLAVNTTNDCGPSSSVTVEVDVKDIPLKPTITRQNDSTLLSSSPIGNQWLLNGQPIPGATRQLLTVTKIGDYTLQVKNDCGSIVSDTLKIDFILGVEKQIYNPIKIFPNPADTYIQVEVENRQVIDAITLLDSRGSIVYRNSFYTSSCILPTHHLSSGIYLIRIHTGSKTLVRKISIQ